MSKSFGEWVKMRVLSEGSMGNFDLNDYIEKTSNLLHGMKMTPKIHCKSGLSLSVQAGDGRYSSPRDNEGPYDEVEVGYPSEEVSELMPYIENPDDDPLESIYAYVPVEVVEKVVNKNGGLA